MNFGGAVMLKEREQKILDYMKEEIREKGYPPTVREICSALHIKSTSTAHKDIDSLVGIHRKGPIQAPRFDASRSGRTQPDSRTPH